jgi:hypothetical protein
MPFFPQLYPHHTGCSYPQRQKLFSRTPSTNKRHRLNHRGENMSTMARRIGLTIGTVAAGITMTAGIGAATAQAEPLSQPPAPASGAQPANSGCGYLGYDSGLPVYNNCSPYSVQIRVEHWFGHDTYTCVPAHYMEDIPQGDNSWAIDYAVFDGVTHC